MGYLSGTMTSIVLFFIFYISTSFCQEEIIDDNERNPKILFATTTVSTSQICFIPTSAVSTGLLGCKKKKKKSLNIEDKAPKSAPEILPSPSSVQLPESQDQFKDQFKDQLKEDPNQLVESGQEVEEVRKAKQLLYWATHTSTYTHFTTTTTWTLKSVICTPFGWSMSRCPGS